jgi:hypothetical protein
MTSNLVRNPLNHIRILAIPSVVGLAFLVGLMLVTEKLAVGLLGYLPGVIASWLEA